MDIVQGRQYDMSNVFQSKYSSQTQNSVEFTESVVQSTTRIVSSVVKGDLLE